MLSEANALQSLSNMPPSDLDHTICRARPWATILLSIYY